MVAILKLLSLLLTSTFIASAPSSATTEVQDPPPGNGRRIRREYLTAVVSLLNDNPRSVRPP